MEPAKAQSSQCRLGTYTVGLWLHPLYACALAPVIAMTNPVVSSAGSDISIKAQLMSLRATPPILPSLAQNSCYRPLTSNCKHQRTSDTWDNLISAWLNSVESLLSPVVVGCISVRPVTSTHSGLPRRLPLPSEYRYRYVHQQERRVTIEVRCSSLLSGSRDLRSTTLPAEQRRLTQREVVSRSGSAVNRVRRKVKE